MCLTAIATCTNQLSTVASSNVSHIFDFSAIASKRSPEFAYLYNRCVYAIVCDGDGGRMIVMSTQADDSTVPRFYSNEHKYELSYNVQRSMFDE